MHIDLHVKNSSFLTNFNENLIFIDSFSKNPQMSNFMIICPVGAELFHADGQTDMMNLTVAIPYLRTSLKISRRVGLGGLVGQIRFLHSITYIAAQVPPILEQPNRAAMVIIHVGLANYCNPTLIQGRENFRVPSHFPDKARPRAICNYSPPCHIARKCSSIYWKDL
jgi:hypothetical protein